MMKFYWYLFILYFNQSIKVSYLFGFEYYLGVQNTIMFRQLLLEIGLIMQLAINPLLYQL
jgi:hypothetical protein